MPSQNIAESKAEQAIIDKVEVIAAMNYPPNMIDKLPSVSQLEAIIHDMEAMLAIFLTKDQASKALHWLWAMTAKPRDLKANTPQAKRKIWTLYLKTVTSIPAFAVIKTMTNWDQVFFPVPQDIVLKCQAHISTHKRNIDLLKRAQQERSQHDIAKADQAKRRRETPAHRQRVIEKARQLREQHTSHPTPPSNAIISDI